MNKQHCGQDMVGIEYHGMDKHHYDGVSEYLCTKCFYREGRWCGQELKENEVEPRHCEGKEHPVEEPNIK